MEDSKTQAKPSGYNPSDYGMISGGKLALFIIVGAFIGNFIIYQPASQFGFPLIALIIGFVLCAISYFMLAREKELSTRTYVFTFICCVTLPLFGGLAAYQVLSAKRLTQ